APATIADQIVRLASEPLSHARTMADYERMTAASIREVLKTAEEVLTSRLPIQKVSEDRHSITFKGEDGTVTIEAHRHGPDTLVPARTGPPPPSSLALGTQPFLSTLPSQPGAPARG